MTSLQTPIIREESSDTLTITDMGYVTNISNGIRNLNVSFPVPSLNTSGNRLSNFRGKVRTIVVQGVQTGTAYGLANPRLNVAKFIEEVETWINSGIQNRKRFTDVWDYTYLVFCVNFEHVWDEGQQVLRYTMELVEGADIREDVANIISAVV